MRIKNLHIYPKTVAERDRLAEEYTSIGFYVEKKDDKLTVFALPKNARNKKPKKVATRPRRDRD